MHIRILAVGDRQPAWVDDAFAGYAGRLPPVWRFRLDVLAAAKRGSRDQPDRARASEGERLLEKTAGEFLILLDERGMSLSSVDLSRTLADWQHDGRNLCFVIGGPDGVSDPVRERADFCWSLSPLTLPHGLARVLCVEQLYRAWSLTAGHPYHRA
ncbi:MAG: 23S rRNA (pseudouridine(1915)-N(3))-methyltransferase RlmH [Pseudomonadota bacterium]